jgi:hypothetical protein
MFFRLAEYGRRSEMLPPLAEAAPAIKLRAGSIAARC